MAVTNFSKPIDDEVGALNSKIGALNIPVTGKTGTDITNLQIGWTSTTLGWHLQVTTSNGTKHYIKCDQ